ncbi:MAG: cob(I)yrinic acid a,c-diamide adenosyltransferase, partial [bacterium]
SYIKNSSNKKEVMVVLDEISYPVMWNWFEAKDVVRLMDKYADTHFILTGRTMPQELIEVADTVSTVHENKHAYQNGIQAQKGIEF